MKTCSNCNSWKFNNAQDLPGYCRTDHDFACNVWEELGIHKARLLSINADEAVWPSDDRINQIGREGNDGLIYEEDWYERT